MGTRKHAPSHAPPPSIVHADIDAPPPVGHGFRPGTRSRVMEAQMRAQEHMIHAMSQTMKAASRKRR